MSPESDYVLASAGQLGTDSVETIRELFEQWNAVAFWSGYRSWLERKNYKLYDLDPCGDCGLRWTTPSHGTSDSLPYARQLRIAGKIPEDEDGPRIIAFAQDNFGRDVVIKLVDNDSEELSIYRHLLKCKELFDPGSFACVLPPVDILQPPYDFCFVVMPCWGSICFAPKFVSVREVLNCVRCVIQGLDFLHRNRIAHRDIAGHNILVNFRDCHWFEDDGTRMIRHRSSPDVRYCLFDFNLSRQFPLDMSPQECRVSASESDIIGTPWYHPMDAQQGEYECNPFVFDVGCLGNLLYSKFQAAIPGIPHLVPLFDRMTTCRTEERFTAAEAYKFCVDIIDSLSEVELNAPVPQQAPGMTCVFDAHCWDRVSEGFISVWGKYRTPPVSWSTRLLRWVCSNPAGMRLVRFIRRSFRI